MNIIKNKQIGRSFESYIASQLRNNGFYVYKSGVSTPNLDILALKSVNVDDEGTYLTIALLIETKSLKEKPDYSLIKRVGAKLLAELKELYSKARIPSIPLFIVRDNRYKRKLYIYIYDINNKFKEFEINTPIYHFLNRLEQNAYDILEYIIEGQADKLTIEILEL
jgi:hypothetical protein